MTLRKLLQYGFLAMSLTGNTIAVDARTDEEIAAARSGLSFAGPIADEQMSDEEEGDNRASQRLDMSFQHQPLGASSITVGCTGVAWYVIGPLGDLMRGPLILKAECAEFEKYRKDKLPKAVIKETENTALSERERAVYGRRKLRCLPPHNHPGITVDLLPAAGINPQRHRMVDWLLYQGQPASVEAVFLEQLNPAGINKDNLNVMPEAVANAYRVLQPAGRLVIHLALDVGIYDLSKAELQKYRPINPFIGTFNLSALRGLKNYFQNENRSSAIVVAAVSFYELKVKKLLVDAFGEGAGNEKYDKLYNPHKLIHDFSLKALNTPNRSTDILDDLYKLMSVFRQGDLMIEYLNKKGFRETRLRWLDAGSHLYSPSGGWFMTAIKA